MLDTLKSWAGQVTTGHGVMVLSGVLLSVLSGSMSWISAAPLLVAGVIGLIWPENAAPQTSGQAMAVDVAAIVSAFNHKDVPPPTTVTEA